METLTEGLTADQKAAQVIAAVQPTESDLSDLDELNILEGKGIEYVLKCEGKEDLKLYVKPLTLKEQRLILEAQIKTNGGTVSELEAIKLTTGVFAQIFKVEAEVLEEYLTVEDIYTVFGLFACALYEGKKLFKKKKLPALTLDIATKSIKSALMNPGLLTT